MLGAATAALAALDAARRDVLLGDDVATIRDHESKAAEARINVARLEARLDALDQQAAEIAAAEASAVLTTKRDAVEACAAEMAGWLRDRYPEIARKMIEALTKLHAIEREAMTVNAALFEARRETDQVAGVHARLGMSLGPGWGFNAGSSLWPGTTTSLGSVLHLPELVSGVRAPGWRAPAWT